MVGGIGFHGPPTRNVVEVGYGVVGGGEGRGVATQALLLLLDVAAGLDGVQRVVGRTEESNVASQRVMLAAGMRFVGRDPEFLHFEIDLGTGSGRRYPLWPVMSSAHESLTPDGPPATHRPDLRSPRSTTLIGRMQAIDAALPAADGLACFNRVYLDVTQQVQAQITQGSFSDPDFLTRLDVVFANFYFDAVNAVRGTARQLPAAWAPLLETRGTTAVSFRSSSPWPE